MPSQPGNLVPLSRCALWRRQSEFFDRHGLSSWEREVPYYATSNPAIADAYAQILWRFMVDWTAREGPGDAEPFYLVELGAGHGAFSFLLLRRLRQLRETLGGEGPSFVYVMTDFSQKLIESWQRKAELAPLAAAGLLDFALFDLDRSDEILLRRSGARLRAAGPSSGESASGKPVIVLANYVFDTVSHDLFRLAGGRLQEALLEEEPTVPPVGRNSGVPLGRFGRGLLFRDVELPYYRDEPDLDAILASYCRDLPGETYLLLPVSALRAVGRLLALARGRLLLLATDKGFSRHFAAMSGEVPTVAFHGSMSMMVNFDALGRFFHHRGGEAVHQPTQQSIVTSLLLAGTSLSELPETRETLATWLETFSPANLLALYQQWFPHQGWTSPENLLAYLAVSRWDPQIFNLVRDQILAWLPRLSPIQRADLADALERVGENAYHLPGMPDTLANLGLVFQQMGEHPRALAFFQASAATLGEAEASLYGSGVSHYHLGELAAAREKFRTVVRRQPEDIHARGWLARMEDEGTAGEPSPATAEIDPPSPSLEKVLQEG